MPYDEVRGVQVWGIEPESFDEVTGFAQTLHWTPEGSGPIGARKIFAATFRPNLLIGLEEEGRLWPELKRMAPSAPASAWGWRFLLATKGTDEGTYDPINRWFMPVQEPVVLTTIPPDT